MPTALTNCKMFTHVLIGILSCQKNAYLHKHLKKTWIRDIPATTARALFLVGEKGTRERIENETLYLDCQDDYASLPQKVIRFLQFANKHLTYDYIFKCDDDTYVSKKTWEVSLEGVSFVTGRLLSYQPDVYKRWLALKSQTWNDAFTDFLTGLSHFPCGGEGYFLSYQAVRVILQAYEANTFPLPPASEDMVITQLLASRGIKPTSLPLLTAKPSELCRRWLTLQNTPQAIIHPVPPCMMNVFHQRDRPVCRLRIITREIKMKLLGSASH